MILFTLYAFKAFLIIFFWGGIYVFSNYLIKLLPKTFHEWIGKESK